MLYFGQMERPFNGVRIPTARVSITSSNAANANTNASGISAAYHGKSRSIAKSRATMDIALHIT